MGLWHSPSPRLSLPGPRSSVDGDGDGDGLDQSPSPGQYLVRSVNSSLLLTVGPRARAALVTVLLYQSKHSRPLPMPSNSFGRAPPCIPPSRSRKLPFPLSSPSSSARIPPLTSYFSAVFLPLLLVFVSSSRRLSSLRRSSPSMLV